VPGSERELELDALDFQREHDSTACAGALERLDVLGAEALNLDVFTGEKRLQKRLLGHDRGPTLGQRRDDLGLRLRDLLDGAQQLEVHRADARDHTNVGPGDRAQLGDLAEPAHAHLADDDLRFLVDPRQGQRKADLVVVSALRGDRLRMRPTHGREDVLRRRLARRAGDPDDAGRAARPHGSAERSEPRERILGDQRRRRAARERMSREVLAAADSDEEVALLDSARVDLHACHLLGPGRSVEPAGTERSDLVERKRNHFVAAPSLLRASRATSRSSKGTVRSRNC
jgi:hypothetical protein